MSSIITDIVLPIAFAILAAFGGIAYGKKAEKKKTAESNLEVIKEHAEIDNTADIDNVLDKL